MFYPDLGTQTMVSSGPHVRAIGWLEPEHPYTQGSVDDEFLSALARHVETAWQPVALMGPHTCGFCHDFHEGSNLWLPDAGVVFVAPAMVVHYVNEHDYRPPRAFVDAVARCPEQGSDAYFAKLAPAWPASLGSLNHYRHWR